jgi:hypothetical protein
MVYEEKGISTSIMLMEGTATGNISSGNEFRF